MVRYPMLLFFGYYRERLDFFSFLENCIGIQSDARLVETIGYRRLRYVYETHAPFFFIGWRLSCEK